MNQAAPKGIAIGSDRVYWVNEGDGRLMSSPLGQNLPAVERSNLLAPQDVAVFVEFVYFTELGPPGAVRGGEGDYAVSFAGENEPKRLVMGEGVDLYWANTGDGSVRACDWVVLSCTPVTLATGQAPAALVWNDGWIFWANESQGTIAGCDVSECEEAGPTVLASGQDSPHAIAVDANAVYWATETEIYKCPSAGCGELPPILLATGLKPQDIAVAGGQIYFTDRECNALLRCPVTGCDDGMTTLADGLTGPDRLAIHTNHVYWTNEDGRVLATAR